MDMDYDENLLDNEFLQELRQQHKAILEQVIQEGWIICVPRTGSFQRRNFKKNEINVHILIPRHDLSDTQFDTLDGRKVLFMDKVLTVKHDTERYSSRLLFEETFYSRNLRKYRVWCIEQPLEANMSISDRDLNIITNLQEAVNFLRLELLEKKLHSDLETKVKDFLYINKNLDCKPLQTQRDLVHSLYTDCLTVLLENVVLRAKILNSRYYYLNIRVSLETYILYTLRHILLKSLSSSTAVEDASLNKIMRNLSEIQLNDLQVRLDLQSCVYRRRSELSRLDYFVTVLGKLECLKRTSNCISHGTSSAVTSDDLLPVLIYLVVKSGLSNWTAQLIFMKQFRFSAKSTHEIDESDFLITSLEAAIEHIKSGAISMSYANLMEFGSAQMHNALSEHSSNVKHLFTCIEKGDLPEVERILTYNKSKQVNPVALCHPLCTCVSCEQNWMHRQDSNAYPENDRGLTPLHAAVLYNQTAIVTLLLDHKVDVNWVADADGLTAVHYACMKGQQIILLHLLQANADLTVTGPGGNTPLHLAADRGHESCVKTLLYLSEQMKTTIDVNAANDNGDTALHLAAKWSYCSTVRILLECGANCKLTNRKGQTPLTLTYSKYIAELFNINTRTDRPRRSISSQASKDESVLHPQCYTNCTVHQHMMDRLLAAIMEGDTCLACYYLGLEIYRERVPNVHSTESGLCHPLCDCERCSTISETLEQCNRRRRALAINTCNDLGETALHVASATGRTEIVSLLLDAGANVNMATASEGRTPLHLACLNGNVDAVKLLLNCATCDIDVKDHDGDTSLHLVTRAGNVKLVGLLLRHGANADARNQHNMTPLRQLEIEMSSILPENYADILKMLKRSLSPQSTLND